MSFEPESFLVKEGDKVDILGGGYTAVKLHFIVGINLFEGKLRIRSMKDGEFVVRDYSFKELEESDLVKKEG